ncbi:MAG: CHAT domain-containing protein [Gemmatimonadota bacterium]|nr:MAG: CHAT domain-containing protein [Gemmatimonadota bacterium]
MRAAWETDPTYLPPMLDLQVTEYTTPPDVVQALDSLARAHPTGIGLCARYQLSRLRPGQLNRLGPADVAVPAITDLDRADLCEICVGMMVHPETLSPRDYAALADWLWRRFPVSFFFANLALRGAIMSEDWPRALAVAEVLLSHDSHPFLQALATAARGSAYHGLRRHEEALAVEAEGDRVMGAAAPGLRLAYLNALDSYHWVIPDIDGDLELLAHANAITERRRAGYLALLDRANPLRRVDILTSLAQWGLDNGDLAGSLDLWNASAALADSLGNPRLQAFVYMRRGRTYVKLGDHVGAERDLLAARALTSSDQLDIAAEVEHNLLHLYEGQGRALETLQAGEAFIEYSRRVEHPALTMIAYHDLGWFMQRRGQRERARRLFESMVGAIDTLESQSYYAGEYFERIGELDRAAEYYRSVFTAPRPDIVERSRATLGLVRVAEAIGDTAEAIRYARLHDARESVAYPERVPLLPSLLARIGRTEEAIAELERARNAAKRNGQAAGWARLSLELGAAKLLMGEPVAAAGLADSAAATAERVAEAEIALRAQGLSGLAAVYGGGAARDAGLRRITAALEGAERLSLPQLDADLLALYGDALAAAGDNEGALSAFARAANLSDSIAASLALDADRAGFRAQQLRISGRALAAVLRQPSLPRAPRQYAAWSMRRKSRSIYENAEATDPAPWDLAAEKLGRIRARLGSDDAVLDYVVLDTAVAVLLLTDSEARVIQLPVSSDSLASRVRQIYQQLAPRLGSYVDLSRAAFDVDVARRLYADLLEPLEPLLDGRTRLTVIPDAPLQLLPFDALIVSGPTNAPFYALDRFTITLATSLAGTVIDDDALPAGRVLAASGPAVHGSLIGNDLEITAVSEVLSGREVIGLPSTAATEQAIREYSGSAAVVHFAAHAQPNVHQPDYGYISLTPSGADDGKLHAYEIRELDLRGRLVVLSACESAAGRLRAGEGPLSLGRAFLHAGASGVIATLWPVGPPAAELMGGFYRALAADHPPAAALRAAKLELRNGTLSSPLYWAPFILITR